MIHHQRTNGYRPKVTQVTRPSTIMSTYGRGSGHLRGVLLGIRLHPPLPHANNSAFETDIRWSIRLRSPVGQWQSATPGTPRWTPGTRCRHGRCKRNRKADKGQAVSASRIPPARRWRTRISATASSFPHSRPLACPASTSTIYAVPAISLWPTRARTPPKYTASVTYATAGEPSADSVQTL